MARTKKSESKLPVGMTRRRDGRIMNRFTFEGKRYTVYGGSKDECREKEVQKREELKAGLYKSGKALTVKEYSERWIESKRGTVKETTIRLNTILCRRITETVIDRAGTKFGALKLEKVEPQNVRDLQNALKAELCTRTVNDTMSILKAMFSAAITDRIIVWNPAEGVKPLRRTEERARDTIHRALTREETRAFLDAAGESWYYPLYVFLLNTGLRVGEAGALTPADLTRQGVRISKTITRTESGSYKIGTEAKTTAGMRYVPMSEAARDALNDQKSINAVLRGDKVIDLSQPIFTAPRGGLLKAGCINTDIAKICEAAGVDRFSVHAFRDTFATRCVESGMPPKTLQEIMGHSDINMTLGLYAHAMDETKEKQLQAVNFI